MEHALAIHYIKYNFRRRHQTLGVTPAQAIGVRRDAMTLEEIVSLMDAA